jgi:copper chaperone NosL
MEITEPRFATQVITRTGKVQHFDSVECLVGFVAAAEPQTVRDIWVTDAESPGTFRPAAEAGYLLDGSVRGPMGRAVAFASPEAAVAAQQRLGGSTVSWGALLADSAGIRSHAGH